MTQLLNINVDERLKAHQVVQGNFFWRIDFINVLYDPVGKCAKYEFEITTPCGLKYRLFKRYSDFKELHVGLQRSVRSTDDPLLPKLPSGHVVKQIFGHSRFTADFIQQRADELKEYSQSLLNHWLHKSRQVECFFAKS